MLLKIDKKLPVSWLSARSCSSIELHPRTSIGTNTGDSVLVRDLIFVSQKFWLASVFRSGLRQLSTDRDDKSTAQLCNPQLGVVSWAHCLWLTHILQQSYLIFESCFHPCNYLLWMTRQNWNRVQTDYLIWWVAMGLCWVSYQFTIKDDSEASMSTDQW